MFVTHLSLRTDAPQGDCITPHKAYLKTIFIHWTDCCPFSTSGGMLLKGQLLLMTVEVGVVCGLNRWTLAHRWRLDCDVVFMYGTKTFKKCSGTGEHCFTSTLNTNLSWEWDSYYILCPLKAMWTVREWEREQTVFPVVSITNTASNNSRLTVITQMAQLTQIWCLPLFPFGWGWQ